jgi:hypothetical protein
MTEQIMIYKVKSTASSNAKELFSNDSKYFFWNVTKLKNLIISYFVFVVNRTSKWVLFAQLNKIDTQAIASQPKEPDIFPNPQLSTVDK